MHYIYLQFICRHIWACTVLHGLGAFRVSRSRVISGGLISAYLASENPLSMLADRDSFRLIPVGLLFSRRVVFKFSSSLSASRRTLCCRSRCCCCGSMSAKLLLTYLGASSPCESLNNLGASALMATALGSSLTVMAGRGTSSLSSPRGILACAVLHALGAFGVVRSRVVFCWLISAHLASASLSSISAHPP